MPIMPRWADSFTAGSARILGKSPSQEPQREPAIHGCANCGDPLNGPDLVPRGQDTAWFLQCQACVELAEAEFELLHDRPDGNPIHIYRCQRCGELRSCRPGWRTRCHVCLDDRSRAPWVAETGELFLARLKEDPELDRQARRLLELADDQSISIRSAVEVASTLAVAEQLQRFTRPGWTILATDVYGLPWDGERTRALSHGTWGQHDACGAIGKLRVGSLDCPTCGPEPGSRTHRARRDDPYLLYLVRHKRVQKFGVGDERRVRTHLRGGAEVVQVLRGRFGDVILAERTLKQRHRDITVRPTARGMIDSFGEGTEVVRKRVPVNLAEVLPAGEDVTHWFL